MSAPVCQMCECSLWPAMDPEKPGALVWECIEPTCPMMRLAALSVRLTQVAESGDCGDWHDDLVAELRDILATLKRPERAPAIAVDPSRSTTSKDVAVSALTPPPHTPVEADAPAEATDDGCGIHRHPCRQCFAELTARVSQLENAIAEANERIEQLEEGNWPFEWEIATRERERRKLAESALTAEHTARLAAEQRVQELLGGKTEKSASPNQPQEPGLPPAGSVAP
jgi:exonuclease VII small subunit